MRNTLQLSKKKQNRVRIKKKTFREGNSNHSCLSSEKGLYSKRKAFVPSGPHSFLE